MNNAKTTRQNDPNPNEVRPNRLYKSRIFEMIFSDKKELLKLYNAMNGTNYEDSDLLEINTLENAIYMSMRNDVSFLLDARMNLYEHQSTYSPNLPLRYLFYVSDLYSFQTREANLYGTRAVIIPKPRFIIFYNGADEQPDRQYLKLSDLYTVQDEEQSLELEALMLNINPGYNEELLESCKTLQDYALYTAKVRAYTKSMSLDDAVERAISECIGDDILADFLRKNRSEAKKMSIYEYDEEKHMRQEREESREEGRREGKEEGRREGREEGRKKGKEEGKREGVESTLQLTLLLLKAGRTDDIERAASDERFRQSLYDEFEII